MIRRNFAQILEEAKVDISAEYSRVYRLFHEDTIFVNGQNLTLQELCANNFLVFPFRGTCIDQYDFNSTYGFDFAEHLGEPEINDLLLLCEYTYSFVGYLRLTQMFNGYGTICSAINLFMQQVSLVIDKIGYMEATENYKTIFVPKSSAAIAVAEIVPSPLSYKLIEYSHYALKGNLDAKLDILKRMADDIEPQRKALAGINKSFSETLFQMLNKFVRHSLEKTPYILTLSPEQIEEIYDDIYQMWLLAKLELENVERSRRISSMLTAINK